jgi:transcriptional regulator NrdR family protein
MNCPTCKRKALCIDSRGSISNSTRRRYQCKCGVRFSTMEQVVESATKGYTMIARHEDEIVARRAQEVSKKVLEIIAERIGGNA